MDIKQAGTKIELETVRTLFREYEAFLDVDLCFQSFEEELAGLPGKYGPPEGDLLIALDGEDIIGCVAMRPLEAGICEMKRLYVRPGARGTGLGRRLAEAVIASARRLGYTTMRLGTLEKLKAALGLYEDLGFKSTRPYYDNPLDGVVYLEKDLG
jgi:putative acetyltransferase